jgi:hypothetical protein
MADTQFILLNHYFSNMGIQFFNVHFFGSVFLLHITTYSNIVIVILLCRYLIPASQNELRILPFDIGIEDSLAIGISELVLVTRRVPNSADASINNVALSFLLFFNTIIQVPMVVPKNRSGGNWITAST